VVLTPEAATGIAARDGVHWLVSPADPVAMVGRIADLLADREAAGRLGAAARRFVIAEHGWEAMLAPLAGLVGIEGERARHAA